METDRQKARSAQLARTEFGWHVSSLAVISRITFQSRAARPFANSVKKLNWRVWGQVKLGVLSTDKGQGSGPLQHLNSLRTHRQSLKRTSRCRKKSVLIWLILDKEETQVVDKLHHHFQHEYVKPGTWLGPLCSIRDVLFEGVCKHHEVGKQQKTTGYVWDGEVRGQGRLGFFVHLVCLWPTSGKTKGKSRKLIKPTEMLCKFAKRYKVQEVITHLTVTQMTVPAFR